MKKILCVFLCVFSVIFFCGCSRTERITQAVKEEIEKEEQKRNPNVVITEMVLVLEEGNHYFGIAKYTGTICFYEKQLKEEFNSEVKVTYDGKAKNFSWEHPPFLLLHELKNLLNNEN